VRARLAEGEERKRLWEHGQRWYPGWPKYESRAGPRFIPIFVLEPVSATPGPEDVEQNP
jgi:hypothetical protein